MDFTVAFTYIATRNAFDSLQLIQHRESTIHPQGLGSVVVSELENSSEERNAVADILESQQHNLQRRLRTFNQGLGIASVRASENENAHTYTSQQMYRHLELTNRAGGRNQAVLTSVKHRAEIQALVRDMVVLTQLGGDRLDAWRDAVLRMTVESDSPSQADDACFALCMTMNQILLVVNPAEVFTVMDGNEQPEGAVALKHSNSGDDGGRESIDAVTQRVLSGLDEAIDCNPELVKFCLELLYDLLHICGENVMSAGTGSVLLITKCKSFECVLRLLQYCSSDRFKRILGNISSTLERQTGRIVLLTAHVTQESLNALKISIEEDFKKIPKERILRLETKYAGDVDLYRIKTYLESDRAKRKCQQLASVLSRIVGGRIALTIRMDLEKLKNALEPPRLYKERCCLESGRIRSDI